MKPFRDSFSLSTNLKKLFIADSNRIACLDGLRAISISYLILFHLVSVTLDYLPKSYLDQIKVHRYLYCLIAGHYGVDIFFVISGFLITKILLQEYQASNTLHIKRFYLRRLLRLTPLYYTILFLIALHSQATLHTLYAHLFYLQNTIAVNQSFMIWSWSLAIEMQFYFVYPFILLFCLKHLKLTQAIFILLIVLSTLLSVYTVLSKNLFFNYYHFNTQHYFSDIWNYLTLPSVIRLGPIVAGCMAAYYDFYYREKLKIILNKKGMQLLLVLTLALLIIIISSTPPTLVTEHLYLYTLIYFSTYRNLVGICIALMILMCLHQKTWLSVRLNNCLSHKMWYPIAQLAYASFLINPVIINSLFHHYLSFNQAISVSKIFFLCCSAFLLIFISAAIAYLTIERPLMNMRRFMNHKIPYRSVSTPRIPAA